MESACGARGSFCVAGTSCITAPSTPVRSWKGQRQHISYQHLREPIEFIEQVTSAFRCLEVTQRAVVSCRSPRKRGTAGSWLSHPSIRRSHAGSALWGSSTSSPLSFKRDGPNPLVPAGLALRSHTLGCRMIKIFFQGWYLCKTTWIMLLLS